jgi:hypothetical protein
MPSCGSREHDVICNDDECGPIFKITNKKLKRIPFILRQRELIGKYCNFVCEKCVRWVENENKGVKRILNTC